MHFRQGGPNGIYLFELEAQPGGPKGRSDMTAGSKPISIIEQPRSVRPSGLALLLVVVVKSVGWSRKMVSIAKRFVPNPVSMYSTVSASAPRNSSNHTWYGLRAHRHI